MPITESAKKALRQSWRRRTRNIQKRKEIKKLLKEIEQLVIKKQLKEAKSFLPRVYKLLDKAAKTGLIKRNTAARKKSRITKLVSPTK